jgi:hypothetical protein
MLASAADGARPRDTVAMDAGYGLHVRIEATPGNGDQLEALLLDAAAGTRQAIETAAAR